MLCGACGGGGVLGTGLQLGSAGAITIESPSQNVVLRPKLRTRVYRSVDRNTADFYLSDLEEDQLLAWLSGEDTGASGNLIHIHMFLYPKAGRTPIDYTASNITITHTVIAGGVYGVYGGGGFMLPSGTPGDKTMGGNVRDASLRFLRGSDGFVDRIEAATFAGGVNARHDEFLAARIATLIAAAGR
jgi:hypothetical protein